MYVSREGKISPPAPTHRGWGELGAPRKVQNKQNQPFLCCLGGPGGIDAGEAGGPHPLANREAPPRHPTSIATGVTRAGHSSARSWTPQPGGFSNSHGG